MSDAPNEWFVYEHTVEGLFFKALRERINPSMQARLKPLGIDLDGKPKSVAYVHWKQALTLAATELFEGTEDERFRKLGRAVLQRYEETLMGKTVVGLMRLMGPKRILQRINSTLRSGNNYIEATLTQTGPTAYEGLINECNGNPNYIVGVIEQGLIIAGAKEAKIEAHAFDGHRAKFVISWSA
jgi:uncharacterized protein (TIGR02265 family)